MNWSAESGPGNHSGQMPPISIHHLGEPGAERFQSTEKTLYLGSGNETPRWPAQDISNSNPFSGNYETMLRFAEELLILLLDEEKGDFINIPERTLNYALSAAVLLELALENRIDTDDVRVTLVDDTPLDDDLFDPILADMAREIGERGPESPETWVRRLAAGLEELREKVVSSLGGVVKLVWSKGT